jgi:hypothetical protein
MSTNNDLTIYNQYAPVMKTGDTLLYKSDGVVGFVISGWVKMFFKKRENPEVPIYNHSNLVIRFSEYEGLTNRRWVLNTDAKGANPILLSRYLTTHQGSCYYYPLIDQYDCTRNDIGGYAISLAGTHYDLEGLVKNAIGNISSTADKLWCSESNYLSYRDGGNIVVGDKIPRPDQLPFICGKDGKTIFKTPIKLF